MNRIYLIFFSLLLFLFFQIPVVKKNIVEFANFAKDNFIKLENQIYEKINFFKNQQQKIKYLEFKNKELMLNLAKLESVSPICKDLLKFQKINIPNLYFVETISYAALPDFSQIYINYPKKIIKPKGLVYNNLAAGEVIENFGNYSLALLNSNPRVTYTVIIGDKEIPGIFYGEKNVVKYIKKYVNLKIGDIVKTSGLDGIFYKGALVGKVTEIIQKKLYQEVKVKLFYNKLSPDFFYVVEKNNTIKKILRRGNGNKSN